MVALERSSPSARQVASGAARGFVRVVRMLPLRWRILAIAAANTLVVVILAALIWSGAETLTSAWSDVRQVRQSDRLLALLESEAGRLQSLIHRYFNQPDAEVFAEITLLREALLTTLKNRAAVDPMLAGSVQDLVGATERFLAGFGDLRSVQVRIVQTYENDVLTPAREMSRLYAVIDGASGPHDAQIRPLLSKSREAFSAALLAANSYYLSVASSSAADATRSLDTIEQSIPGLTALADNDVQRDALARLRADAARMRTGLQALAEHFATQTQLLRDAIDGNQAAMATAIDQLSAAMRGREELAQERFDRALGDVYRKIVLVGLGCMAAILVLGAVIAGSIIGPLRDLMKTMHAIVAGRYDGRVEGLAAHDEIGEMARAVEVFRENAIAKQRAEDELRAAKERAEQTLSELRDAQTSLIEAEKLAALGGLVAGVAHEVNNPVGISLTVASSLARRSELFAADVEGGQLRRSSLAEFLDGTREAAKQLVANLQRAGELIQAFKQVAVDRSHADRRLFDLRQSTGQIISSLRPGLKKSRIALAIDIPEGITLDSYPGHYGQLLTNLFLNAATHGFGEAGSGTIRIAAHKLNAGQVELTFADDGKGMSEDVQRRAFDPFFTTQRGRGGTGLGLHIVHNLVTNQLGGRISLSSAPGKGTTFRIVLPTSAPLGEAETAGGWTMD